MWKKDGSCGLIANNNSFIGEDLAPEDAHRLRYRRAHFQLFPLTTSQHFVERDVQTDAPGESDTVNTSQITNGVSATLGLPLLL